MNANPCGSGYTALLNRNPDPRTILKVQSIELFSAFKEKRNKIVNIYLLFHLCRIQIQEKV